MRLFLALAVTCGLAAPAIAESKTDMPTVASPHLGHSITVSTHDLDLNSARGQRELDVRLWRAARDVCVMTAMRDLHEQRLAGRCRSDALARVAARRAPNTAD